MSQAWVSSRSVVSDRLRAATARVGVRWLSRIATAGLATCLVFLTVGTIWGILDSNTAIATAEAEGQLSSAYGDVESAALAAKRAQRDYLNATDPAQTSQAMGDYRQAQKNLVAATSQVRSHGQPQDRTLASYIAIEMRRFDAATADLFKAADTGRAARQRVRTQAATDKSLDTLETLVSAAADVHRSRATDAITRLTVHQRRQVVVVPSILGVASVFLILCWLLLMLLQKELRHQAEEQRYRAEHDALTGLWNRVGFLVRLQEDLDRVTDHCGGVTVLLLDLDNFKPVNDRWGHEAGDEVLRSVAGMLTRTFRPEDVAARLGGDEFGIVMNAIDPEVLPEILDGLCAALAEPHAVTEHLIATPASIGVAVSPGDGTTVEDLLRKADLAMYQAKGLKSNGGGRWCAAREPAVVVPGFVGTAEPAG